MLEYRCTRACALLVPLLVGACASAAPAPQPAAVEFFAPPENWPYPFSPAVRVGDLLFLSGQIGTRPGTAELVPGGIEAEARQTMENIRAALHAAGSSLDRVVKCTVFLEDMADWPAFNAIYRTYFTPPYPTRSALGADGLALGARVEVECVAAAGGRRDPV